MNINSVKVSHRDLTAKQRAALRRIIRFVCKHNSVRRLRYELHRYSNDRVEFTSVVVTGHDGVNALGRMLLTRRVHAALGERGGIKLLSARSGLNSNITHARYMLHCS